MNRLTTSDPVSSTMSDDGHTFYAGVLSYSNSPLDAESFTTESCAHAIRSGINTVDGVAEHSMTGEPY